MKKCSIKTLVSFLWLLKSISENETIAGFLSPFSAVLMFCCLRIASEGWWLLLQFGWAVCKLPPPVAPILSSSGKRGYLSFAKSSFSGLCLSFTIGKLWGGCGTALGRACELCGCSNVRRHWLCFRPVRCHMDLQESLYSAEGKYSWLGVQLLSKAQICGYPGGSLVLTLGTTEPWQCDLQAPSSLLSPSLYVLGFFFFFSISMATETVGFVWPL